MLCHHKEGINFINYNIEVIKKGVTLQIKKIILVLSSQLNSKTPSKIQFYVVKLLEGKEKLLYLVINFILK